MELIRDGLIRLIYFIHEDIIGLDIKYLPATLILFISSVLLTAFAYVVFSMYNDSSCEEKKEAHNKSEKASASDQNNKTAKSDTIYNIKKFEVNNVTYIEVNNITYTEVKTGQENPKEQVPYR